MRATRSDTLSIRRHTYRGRGGYLLTGHPSMHPSYNIAVFDTERVIIERIRDAYRADDPDPTRFLCAPFRDEVLAP